MTLDAFIDRLEGVKEVGGGYVASCPAHDDQNPSLSVTDGDDRILILCHGGCETGAILAALQLDWSDLFYDNEPRAKGPPEAEYFYTDEHGELLYKICRFPGKVFVPFRPIPEIPGAWERGLGDVRRVLYRLPELAQIQHVGRTVYIPEGEKDADALRALGLTATCNPGGAGKGKWLATYVRWFRDCNAIIPIDLDPEGQGLDFAEYKAESLTGIAKEVWIVAPAYGKDTSDHLQAGLKPNQFHVVRRAA